MAQFESTIRGPFLDNMLALMRLLVGEPLAFREEQAKNAAYATYYDQVTLNAGQVYTIEQAQSGTEYYTTLFLAFEPTSGTGRYMLTAQQASNAQGFSVPSGQSFITITGNQNIKYFSLTPDTGQQLIFSRVLFR